MLRPFGSIDGVEIAEITLSHPDGMEMRVLSWGAVICDLVVPSPAGPQPVVLGLDSIDDYAAHSPYFGAIVGRYANRIGRARFVLDGITYLLAANDGRNQLHGGPRGFGTRPWTILDHQPTSVSLALVSQDGDMGYPGRLLATCTYTLSGPATLRVDLEAVADKRTPVNLTNHAYFNLDGSPDISSHQLMIAADFITPTQPDLIPTGAIKSVAATVYDFRTLRPVGAPAIAAADLVRHQLRAARLRHPVARRHPNVPAKRPRHGIVDHRARPAILRRPHDRYPGARLRGAHYGPHAALCLEPKGFPTAPIRPTFHALSSSREQHPARAPNIDFGSGTGARLSR